MKAFSWWLCLFVVALGWMTACTEVSLVEELGDSDASTSDVPSVTCDAGCDSNATCQTNLELPTCICNEGFSGDGATCEDIDECSSSAPCDPVAECMNTIGGYTCTCPDGYTDATGTGASCEDVDECSSASATICPANATCLNTPGTYACECDAGFINVDNACVSAQDCSGKPELCATEATCTVQPDGTGLCVCDSGFTGDGLECANVDECAQANNCDPNATCTDTEGSYVCACPTEGFIDVDQDGTLCQNIDECAGGIANCSPVATCTDTVGSFSCECPDGLVGDGTECTGGAVVGDLTPDSPGQFEDGSVAESCLSYRYPKAPYAYEDSGDGYYLIGPEGFGTGVAVYCDMTTRGGGWTGIDPQTASELGIAVTDTGAGGCGFNGDNPRGHIAGNLSCNYDIAVGFAFNTLRTQDVVFVSASQGTQTTDLTYVDLGWGTPFCGSTGDARFGTPAASGPSMSLGRARGEAACVGYTSYAADVAMPWPDEEAFTAQDQTLRLDFGENGGEDEGFEWTAGRVLVRLSVAITGSLTVEDPGRWDDGNYAESCQAYRYPGDSLGVYGGATGDGYYAIQPLAAPSPITVYCDMTTDGGGWTGIDPATAQTLGVTVSGSTACTFNGDNPEGHAPGLLSCTYDIPTGFSFNTIRTEGVVITSTAQGSDTSDVTFSDLPWGSSACEAVDAGDVRLGTPAVASPILSLGQALGAGPCASPLFGRANGETINWPDSEGTTATGNVLRLEFGEDGTQNEGFEWTGGWIFVRHDVTVVGGLTEQSPALFADGSAAPSCADYRNPKGLYAYYGVTGDGYYAVEDANGDVAPVRCDMVTDGGGWTEVVDWDRVNDGDTLADFESAFTLIFNDMTQFDEQDGYIRWSDGNSDRDVLAYEAPVVIPNGGEARVEVNYTATSLENSGVWLFALSGNAPTNLLCWDDTASEAAYSAQDLNYVPNYACPNDDPPLTTVTWTWDRDVAATTGTVVTAFRLHSLHSDCCIDGGDSSDLSSLTFWVR